MLLFGEALLVICRIGEEGAVGPDLGDFAGVKERISSISCWSHMGSWASLVDSSGLLGF